MLRSVLVCVTVVLLVATVGAGAPLTAGTTTDGPATAAAADRPSTVQDDGPRSASLTTQEFDRTRFEITVYENGTATWTFRYERHLSSESDREEFEAFAEDFEEEETDLYVRFTEQAEALTQSGADKTDREMEATDFRRTATIEHRPNAMGVIEMSFTWENFAVVEDDGTVTVGDVFAGGLYIGSTQHLQITAGDDLVFSEVRPTPTDQSGDAIETSDWVNWEGEREFLDGQPEVVLEPTSQVESDEEENDTDGADNAGGDPPGTSNGGDGSPWLLAAGVLVAVLGLGAVFAWRRFGDPDPAPGSGRGPIGPDGPSVDDSGGRIAGAGAASNESDEPDPDPIPEEELMTDEDRVVSLIRENGGRMKQVNIVEQTGWSKSKVSMLLSDMEDEGTVSKLRVGRENIISLEGFEPEATKSPFEE